jgi:hypothetical protein
MKNSTSFISFHNNIDITVRPYQSYQNGKWGNANIPMFTTIDKGLTFQFSPHFHPYVKVLAQQLINNGVSALLGMDTQYVSNADGSLVTIPNSTRAVLVLPSPAQPTDSSGNAVYSGAPLTLPDGTSVNIAAGQTVMDLQGNSYTLTGAGLTFTTPGFIPSSSTSGTQINPSPALVIGTTTLTTVVIPDGASATLPSASGVTATTSIGTQVLLPTNTQIAIRSGLPKPKLYETIFSPVSTTLPANPDPSVYNPSTNVLAPFPVKNLDFSIGGAYSIYNWELFFHAPLLIAIQLSQSQQFQDAQNWFHTIFDPTDDSDGPVPARFWKLAPFQYADVESIGDILVNLSTGENPQLQQDTTNSINAWISAPFQPFVVAQFRPTAYMLKTVMAYLDNLIAWGDSLFSQYTKETITEATQIYILAANILGDKPQVVPIQESTAAQSYSTLKANLKLFGDALVDMEVDVPFDLAPAPSGGSGSASGSIGSNILNNIGQNSYSTNGTAQALFFCVPQNTTLLAYWDTVADRLFKIHNSLNIQGVFQQLPLFDPPIDPALLVQAAAEGLDVSAIVNGLNQPLPLVRFRLLVAKAAEICQEVKSLGAGLLAAIEKEDNEALSLLRAQHETILLNLGNTVKYSQWQDAIKSRQALEQSLANSTERYTYYQLLLGQTTTQINNNIPQMAALDTAGLQNLSFSQTGEDAEPQMTFQPMSVDIAQTQPTVSDGQITTVSSYEAQELTSLASALNNQLTAGAMELAGAELSLIPQFDCNVQPMGCGASLGFGGVQLHTMASAMASATRMNAEQDTYQANQAAKLGSYDRRQDEWVFQSNMAQGEMNAAFKQLRGAQIREAIAQTEYNNYQKQMKQAQDIQNFLNGQATSVGTQGQYQKTSTVGFYLWMKGTLQTLYSNSFQLAFSVAKKAEQALQHELGNPSLSYIQSNYLNGMQTLLAGEKLLYDAKRMEMDYYDLNAREYELTKQVSLLQVAPLSLIQLRSTGTCMVSLPEELFDLDGPGHYFRRIKSVAVTIPCVAGPYTGVNCTLALQNSTIRTSTDVSAGYARTGANDTRFSDYFGTVQAIVTSSAQSDSGLFETNLNDERYLPFEYSGAISQWQLTLPSGVPQFDFDTITDVVLHIRYTAREGGTSVNQAAVANLTSKIKKAATVGSVRLFSMRHEFPSAWAKFKSTAPIPAGTAVPLTFSLWPQHFPYWAVQLGLKFGSTANGVSNGVSAVQFFAETTSQVTFYDNANTAATTTNKDPLGLLGQNMMTGSLKSVALPPVVDPSNPPTTPYSIYCDNNSMTDLWMAVTWPKS